jgi:membrane AbrB-like protein
MLVPLKALAVCFIGGAICQFLKTPLPWMIGPLLAMATLKFSGLRLCAPKGGRELGQLVIGTALGLYFTPQVAQQVLGTWPVLIAAALLATALGWICGLFLSRYTGTDRTTAFFASVPGGATEMAILGERFGAKPDRIALAQSLRIMMVVVIIPFGLTYFNAHGADIYARVLEPVNALGLIQLLAMGLLGGALPTMVLATAPGGIAEMCITAKALQLGVPLVTAAHVTRVLILATTTAPLFRLAQRLSGKSA